jgi:hypothetical protein
MALIDGDNAISGSILSHQQHNRLKNHWRAAVVPANAQPGMLWSEDGTNKLWHITDASGGIDEVLQATLSQDVSPIFEGIILNIQSADVSDPPTEAELAAIWPSAVAGFTGYVLDSSSGGKLYKCIYDGSSWWTFTGTLAL